MIKLTQKTKTKSNTNIKIFNKCKDETIYICKNCALKYFNTKFINNIDFFIHIINDKYALVSKDDNYCSCEICKNDSIDLKLIMKYQTEEYFNNYFNIE